MTLLRSLSLACGLLLPAFVVAQVPVESDPRIKEQTSHIPPRTPDEEWREGAFELPPFPADDARLLPVPGQSAASALAVFLDPASVSVGEDGVSRYTVVLTSPRGARNVLFEGLRCSEGTLRVYAYGDGRGGFGAVREARWEPVRRESGTFGYRHVLYRSIVCDQYRRARTPAEIDAQLRYSKGSMDEREY